MSKKVLTLCSINEFKFKEKGSLFIGYSFPVESNDESGSKLNEITKKHYDATHNCYAYKLFDGSFKYSDDGEPTGTAGIRIFNAIKHFNLVNAIVIVTRYYGGTKLGVGALGAAYYNAAHGSIENAVKREKEIYRAIEISFDFDMTSNVHHFISMAGVKNIVQSFDNRPVISCFIKQENTSALESSLVEVSKGKIKMKIGQLDYLI